MSNKENIKPPKILLAFFRWYCNPDLREEIEGDLLERFQKEVNQQGQRKARILFFKEVIQLFRPAIIGNFYQLTSKLFPDMKKLQWVFLVALNLLIILCILLPFLPGPYDKLSAGLSGLAQLIGFLGLLLVPIGVLWLIQEIKKLAGNSERQNNWTNGFYFAITATIIGLFFSLFVLMAMFFGLGPSGGVIGLGLIGFALYKFVPAIKNLRSEKVKGFNAAPLYLLSIPIIAFTIRVFFIGPASDYSRHYAIKRGQEVVSAIENYYSQRNRYPESIHELYDLPKPSIMGIREFGYERNGNGYNLYFVQWQHLGATREVVMYNKNDEHNVKGHFASYDAKLPHWRYYWLD